MAKEFNIQGGYFSPPGFLKVETGGSHEENPNGGVQIGVDPNGIPNMLEEGEPVYNDYVYSDNIKAEKGILEQFNIPSKYSDKLYSEIADAYVDEAEDRPLDAISNNGLRVMLGRLADAQEQQKQNQQQKELEDELANLSPDELAELEAMLAGQQQLVEPEQMAAGVISPGQMPMSAGGAIRRFDGGTPGEVVIPSEPPYTGEILPDYRIRPLIDLSDTNFARGLRNFGNSPIGEIVDAVIPDGATDALGASPLIRQAGRTVGPIGRAIGRGVKKAGNAVKNAPKKLFEIAGRKEMLSEAGTVAREARASAKSARDAANAVASELESAKAALKAAPNDRVLLQKVADLEAQSAKADVAALKAGAEATGATLEAGAKATGAFTTGPLYNRAALEKEVSGLRAAYESAKSAADAAPKDKALQEAAELAKKNLEKAEGAWNKWWKHGEWQLKGAIAGGAAGYGAASANQKKKRNWVEKQLAGGGLIKTFGKGGSQDGDDEYTLGLPLEVQPYGSMLYFDVPGGGRRGNYVEIDNVINPKDDIVVSNSGALSVKPTDNRGSRRVLRSPLASLPDYDVKLNDFDYTSGIDFAGPEDVKLSLDESLVDTTPLQLWTEENRRKWEDDNKPNTLPTWMRYVGGLGHGLLALSNIAAPQTKFSAVRIKPYYPTGNIQLRDLTYNPVDVGLATNQTLAQGANTVNALRNSGLGPSTAAAILAADRNIGQNLGNTFLQVWDANNQRRNEVIAANNGNAAQRANFNYAMSAARAQALDAAQRANIQNDLLLQRLNDQAESQKYAAISGELGYGLDALARMGDENVAYNMVNSVSPYGYRDRSGRVVYRPSSRRGLLLKKYNG